MKKKKKKSKAQDLVVKISVMRRSSSGPLETPVVVVLGGFGGFGGFKREGGVKGF